ncbi:MAG: hypothetical protein LBV17_02120, partial [Treponema sp.]|nr:hypothetical protein [Treponema sp.]
MATAASKKRKPSRKAPPSGKGLTFEKVWAMMQETDRQMKENAGRFDREMKKHAERFDREMKKNAEENAERQKETERQMKESADQLNKQLGKLGNRFGEMIEYMVVPNLISKFNAIGFVFEKAYKDATIKDKENDIYTEIDITLE